MRTELWGLRDRTTHEPVYTYWASSNKYRALFAKRETAEDACRSHRNQNMEPFCITSDPIYAARGCYCGECRYYVDAYGNSRMMCMRSIRAEDYAETGYMFPLEIDTKEDDFCSYGEPREAKDDG